MRKPAEIKIEIHFEQNDSLVCNGCAKEGRSLVDGLCTFCEQRLDKSFEILFDITWEKYREMKSNIDNL